MAGWLTVPEVAARFRVSERTVYRWYKSGRLNPVKIGREWLLPDTEQPSRLEPDADRWKGHVLVLVDTLEQASALEEQLLALGRLRGARLFRGQWRQPVNPPDFDLGALLRTGGHAAVVDVWRHEVAAASREGRTLCALSDPPPRDFQPPRDLIEYERACNEVDIGEGSIVCPYRCDQLTGPQLSQLLYVHDAVYLPWEDDWSEFRRTPSA
jgi:excisionase family DNA binding protein